MKRVFGVGLFTFFGFISHAWAAGSGVPITCYGDKHGSGKSAPKQYPCHNADISGAIKSKAVTFKNICLYVNGGWRIGTLTKPKNMDASSLSATNFKEKFPCTFGVEMVSKQSDSLKILGPSVNDVIAVCAAGDKACLNTIDSAKIEVPRLSSAEVIATCYTKQDVGGTSEGSVSCSQSPSMANYCAYEDVQSASVPLPDSDKKRFKGKWFIVYSNPGKKSPKVCKGGVQVSDSSSQSVEQEVVLSGTVDGTRNVLKAPVTMTPHLRSTSMTFTTDNPLFVVGCHGGSGSSYKACQNEGGCDMTDIKCSKVSEHPKTKDKEKTCYYLTTEGKWYYLDKHNKPPLTCANIDVTSQPRPDVNTAKSEQQNSSISLEVGSSGKATVSIGANTDESKRALSVIGSSSLEVVGIGVDALLGVCTSGDCSGFRVTDFSGGKTQGTLYVKGGAQFGDSVNFNKDVVINGSQKANGDLSVGKNINVSGTVTAASDRRLKESVHEIKNVLDKIMNIRGVYYRFDEKKFSLLRPEAYVTMTEDERGRFFGQQRLGFIAQELEKVFPEAVMTDMGSSHHVKSVSYGEMSSVAIQGIKELYLELQKIKNEVKQLKQENKKLREHLEREK